MVPQAYNPLWPNDFLWQHRCGSILAQVMACCLMAPSHYLNQCWRIIKGVLWQSHESNDPATIVNDKFENYIFKFTATSPRGQWVNGVKYVADVHISRAPEFGGLDYGTDPRSLTHWGRDEVDAISQTTFSNAFSWKKMSEFRLKFPLKFVPKSPIDNIPELFQIMAWRRPGDRPLSEAMMVSFLTHICVAQPQWVNPLSNGTSHVISPRKGPMNTCPGLCTLVQWYNGIYFHLSFPGKIDFPQQKKMSLFSFITLSTLNTTMNKINICSAPDISLFTPCLHNKCHVL